MPNRQPVHDALCNAQRSTIVEKVDQQQLSALAYIALPKSTKWKNPLLPLIKFRFSKKSSTWSRYLHSHKMKHTTFFRNQEVARREKKRENLSNLLLFHPKRISQQFPKVNGCAQSTRVRSSLPRYCMAQHTIDSESTWKTISRVWKWINIRFFFHHFFWHHRRQTFSSALSVDATRMCVLVGVKCTPSSMSSCLILSGSSVARYQNRDRTAAYSTHGNILIINIILG